MLFVFWSLILGVRVDAQNQTLLNVSYDPTRELYEVSKGTTVKDTHSSFAHFPFDPEAPVAGSNWKARIRLPGIPAVTS